MLFSIFKAIGNKSEKSKPSKASSRQKLIAILILATIGIYWYSDMYSKIKIETTDFKLPTKAIDIYSNQITENQLPTEPFLINAFATWCTTCRVEHPYLLSLKRQGIKIIGLNYKDNSQDARNWLEDHGNPFNQTIYDGKGRLAASLNIDSIPVTLLIDSNLKIAYRHVGEINNRNWAKIKPEYEKLIGTK